MYSEFLQKRTLFKLTIKKLTLLKKLAQVIILAAACFSGKYGHVRYSLKAILVKPGKANKSIKIAFTVLDMVNLNKIPNINVRNQLF